ncbi:four helix bundle protein [Chloracidobacterium sp. MS 40/45]|jgi:four helix bundle protein|uniref:four helix bundle protein n=1 Tax=Chloracidobacterium aggregatum TaxID=2851959 RepID=UPI001B8AAAAE|nr:four helix bundle protein [Chloracidobacterium aggregatum]QUW01818.1 four helix bundle protein [Chloracidobacterium sp. MS 40/45]
MSFHDYRDLEVWQKAILVAKQIYLLSEGFPPSERYGLTSQMRRAAVSIPANIAEGWGRRYTTEFIQFLRYANGSRTELETLLMIGVEINLTRQEAVQPILEELQTLGRQINNLERSLQRKKNSP